ncbi:hypothetical protein AOXY_G10870 [Acipenser oxyrinchus oxyrinchus]|uniref:Uncharacterized protein n=1 Tax=Acipenser oxyrinchus oxyrinchus TaxID=40147 RepID=A0AAD8DG16_ACIOX|nr:hypothetical protein AOXY_G10870 [Acipenser oxyrinchus oxyrinchus]
MSRSIRRWDERTPTRSSCGGRPVPFSHCKATKWNHKVTRTEVELKVGETLKLAPHREKQNQERLNKSKERAEDEMASGLMLN